MKRICTIVACALVLTACDTGPESARGFRLPDGDVERGRQAFEELRCSACHSIEGIDFERLGTGAADVELGGTVTRVKTYGELVTAIINPSHRLAPGYPTEKITADGESVMTVARLNEVMTVQQLIDVVAFLQDQYEVAPPQYDPYSYVYF